MKIGIACYPTYGGSGVVASELGRALRRRGHEVHLFSYRVPFKVNSARDGICVHEVSDPHYPLFEHPSYGMALGAEIAKVVRQKGLDIIHAHYAYPHALSALMARELLRTRTPGIVTTLHGTDITLVARDNRFAELVRFGIESSDRVTAVSRWLAEKTTSLFGSRSRIDVIPNFVDVDVFRPKRRRRRQAFTLIYVSNFRPVKRPLDAVEVFRRAARGRRALLLMIGDGPELEPVKRHVRRRGLQGRVGFLAPRRDVADVISRGDAMIVTSESEAFGLVALEAMACGLPVVTTQAGGIRELVSEGRTGFLRPVGDIEGLAAKVRCLMDDEERRREMGSEARRIAVDRFAASKIVPMYESLYAELL